MLLNISETFFLAKLGLTVWLWKMVPALFPFMVLSKTIIDLNITNKIFAPINPIIKKIFKISTNGVFCLIVGFLFGFPLGIKSAYELNEKGQISKNEAKFLASFCNCLSPAFIIGYAYPKINLPMKNQLIVIYYTVPLIYGFILRYTIYKNKNLLNENKTINENSENSHSTIPRLKDVSIILENAITSSIKNILLLGGYIIIFNMLNVLFINNTPNIKVHFAMLLEVTGGLIDYTLNPYIAIFLLAIGGLSGISQAGIFINKMNLSIIEYTIHKINIAILIGLFTFIFSSL